MMEDRMEIRKDNAGQDVIWAVLIDKPIPLPVENIYIRAVDGHVFTGPPEVRGLDRLRPHEIRMVEFWLEKKGEVKPNIFAGRIPPDG